MAGYPGLHSLDVFSSMSPEPDYRSQQTRANEQPESNGLSVHLPLQVLVQFAAESLQTIGDQDVISS
jgi:hypothetical protein